MKQRLSIESKTLLVRQYENGKSVTEICEKNSVSRSTFYLWVKKYNSKVIPQNSFKLNQKLQKSIQKLEVLKQVSCTSHSPLKEKLYELEKLHGKYSVYVLCEALDVSRGTYYNHILRNKKQNVTNINMFAYKNSIDIISNKYEPIGGISKYISI